MPIVKPGFRPGFRGRTRASAWSRRVRYLVAEANRDSARLLGEKGQELTPAQAIEVLGGPTASYHEVIVSPSKQECEAIRARCPDDPDKAVREAGNRIGKAYAKGRPHVLAIHEQDGRFHFHIAVSGPMPTKAMGRHGQIQKTWDCEFYGDEPQIRDWEAYRRFKARRAQLQQIIRQQAENESQRREAIRRSENEKKREVASPFERTSRALVELRYQLEVQTIHARYEARGTVGSPRHQAELEQADHRRTGSLRRLEKRETARQLGATKARAGHAVDIGGHAVQGGTRVAARVTRRAVDQAMEEMGTPRPIRMVTRASVVLAQKTTEVALKTAQEAAKAVVKCSVHLAQATAKVGVGLVAAIPTAGVSLKAAGKEALRDLVQAGKELGEGALRTGAAAGKGAAQTAGATGRELVSTGTGAAAEAIGVAGGTATQAIKDILTGSPVSLGKTLASGVIDFAKTASGAAETDTIPPDPVQVALRMGGWIPVVWLATKHALEADTSAQPTTRAASGGMEVDR